MYFYLLSYFYYLVMMMYGGFFIYFGMIMLVQSFIMLNFVDFNVGRQVMDIYV